MARTFEYAVLTAIPDPRRGERVNVGAIVFHEDRIDVRFHHASYKIRALTGDAMSERLEGAEARFTKMFRADQTAAELVRRFQAVEPLLHVSDLGWLRIERDDQYEERVQDVLQSLIAIPKRQRTTESRTSINSEVAKEFKRIDILAKKGEDISVGKVVQGYPIRGEAGLTADFALQNGALHVTSTLDMRKLVGMGEAALKSIILDRAKEDLKAKTLGVFAVDKGMVDHFRPQLALFETYADEMFDWGDPESRKRLDRRLCDAIGASGDLI